MKFVIITHTKHILKDGKIFAYAPYVREMNLWTNYVTEVLIVAPTSETEPTNIHLPYDHSNVSVLAIPAISLISFSESLRTLYRLPVIKWKIVKAFKQADHIHLRCPGNIALLGCILQVLFPKKIKTAKYAGNWDPKAKQPWSYRFQKWLLSSTFLTRNMTVLVYGEWPNQSKNIRAFFTATYFKDQIESVAQRKFLKPFRFIFVGSLSPGKRPLYAMELVQGLVEAGFQASLDFYGEGKERQLLENYIDEFNLKDAITLHGNQTAGTLVAAYKLADFIVLPSKSEGWPKAVAEGMFWGAIPIATRVSCVPWMLGNGERGILIEGDLDADIRQLTGMINDPEKLTELSLEAQKWSRKYTLDTFETEIAKLLLK
jgi:glycosyltransferase involved in cell wall biosynthesis